MFRNVRAVFGYLEILVPQKIAGPLNYQVTPQLILTRTFFQKAKGKDSKEKEGELNIYEACKVGSPASIRGNLPYDCRPRVHNVNIFEHNAAWCGLKQQQQQPDVGPVAKLWREHQSLIVAVGLVSLGAGFWAINKLLMEPEMTHRRPKNATKIPAESEDIPNNVPYLLIGGGAASFYASNAIKSLDPAAKILIISSQSHYPYMKTDLSKLLRFSEDEADNADIDLFYQPDDFYTDCKALMSEKNGIAVARGWTVKSIDVTNRVVSLEDGYEITYDKCLVATGSTPLNLPVFEEAPQRIQNKVILYRDLYDLEDLEEIIQCGILKDIAVVGDDFIGTELACSLAERGKKEGFTVHHITAQQRVMGPVLPEYLGELVSNKMKQDGVDVIEGSTVEKVSRRRQQLYLSLSNGDTVAAESVIVSVGSRPNTELAESSGLQLQEPSGGIAANQQLQAGPNLWIAGDCASIFSPQYQRQLRLQHHDHGEVSGRLAGENMAGAAKEYLYRPKLWVDLGPDLRYEAVGMVDSALDTVAVFAKESDSQERFHKGVVFYMCRDSVVGIVLWNMGDLTELARQLLEEKKTYDDINDVANKLLMPRKN